MIDDLIRGGVVGALAACVGIIVSSWRSGSSELGKRSKRIESFIVSNDASVNLKKIVKFALLAGYKIPAMDQDKGQLVLEESGSLTSWGFFFPVFVTSQPGGSARIEVGITSKLVQYGPEVSRSHERCVNSMKAFLFASAVK